MGETQYSHVKCTVNKAKSSLRKQTSFHNASTGFSAKSHLRNGWRDSILVTCYSPDLGSASEHKICFKQIYPDLGSWLCLEICLKQIRSNTQICSHSSDVISWGNQWWGQKNGCCFLRLEKAEKMTYNAGQMIWDGLTHGISEDVYFQPFSKQYWILSMMGALFLEHNWGRWGH